MRILFALLFACLFVAGYRVNDKGVAGISPSRITQHKDSVRERQNEKWEGCIFYSEPMPGDEWKMYLINNLAPDSAQLDSLPAGEYMALIRFVIDSSGKIGDVIIKKDPGHGLGERAAEVIAGYSGSWNWTVSSYGRQAKTYRTQPITFVIEEEENECKDSLLPNLVP